MIIETIDGEKFDTSKQPDDLAELVEKIEGNDVRSFVESRNGACFIWGYLPGGKGWISQHLNDVEHLGLLIEIFNEMMLDVTDNKFKIDIVPNDEESSED